MTATVALDRLRACGCCTAPVTWLGPSACRAVRCGLWSWWVRVAADGRAAGDAVLVTPSRGVLQTRWEAFSGSSANSLAHALAVTRTAPRKSGVAPARRGPGAKAAGGRCLRRLCRTWPVSAPCPSSSPEPEGSRPKGAGQRHLPIVVPGVTTIGKRSRIGDSHGAGFEDACPAMRRLQGQTHREPR